jgi:hypothetical protein
MEQGLQPRESNVPLIDFNSAKITMNWSAVVIIVFGILGVGGGGFSFLSNGVSPKDIAHAVSNHQTPKQSKDKEEHEKKHKILDGKVDAILEKIDAIIMNQHRRKALVDAKRVCSKTAKWRREVCVKELLQKNMENLKEGKTTCANTRCHKLMLY